MLFKRSSEIPMPSRKFFSFRATWRLSSFAALFFFVLGVECPRVMPVEPSAFDGQVAGILDNSISADQAASQLEAAFFALAKNQDTSYAIGELDKALSNALLSESELLHLWERSAAINGRIVDPNAAEVAGAISSRAKEWGLTFDAAKTLIAGQSAAQSIRGPCPTTEADMTLIFVNGIWNTHADFCTSLGKLRDTVRNAGITNIRVLGVYNVSAIDAQRSLFGALVCPSFGSLTRARGAASAICRQSLGKFLDLDEAIRQYVGLNPESLRPGIGNLEAIQNAVRTEVQNGRIVALVGHSQGNLFIRDAVASLGSDSAGSYSDAVGVIEVASPARTMKSPTARVEVCEDAVAALSPRFSSTSCASCSTSLLECHDFVDSYLANATTRQQLLDQLRAYQLSLSNPRANLGTGIVQVTLSWDNSADVDLYVTEPSGTTVYFGHRQGSNGQLDRDDTNGLGPENYYICNQLDVDAGDYVVTVRHFSGASPAAITLRVKAGVRIKELYGTVSTSSDLESFAKIHYREEGAFDIFD